MAARVRSDLLLVGSLPAAVEAQVRLVEVAAQHGAALLRLFTRAQARLSEAAWLAWAQAREGDTLR
jgi:hypothetical protein